MIHSIGCSRPTSQLVTISADPTRVCGCLLWSSRHTGILPGPLHTKNQVLHVVAELDHITSHDDSVKLRKACRNAKISIHSGGQGIPDDRVALFVVTGIIRRTVTQSNLKQIEDHPHKLLSQARVLR